MEVVLLLLLVLVATMVDVDAGALLLDVFLLLCPCFPLLLCLYRREESLQHWLSELLVEETPRQAMIDTVVAI